MPKPIQYIHISIYGCGGYQSLIKYLMSKVKPYTIEPKQRFETINNLFEVISRLKTKKEIIDFFLGLYSQSEALMIARRLQIARLLLEDRSYDYIMKKLRVSSQTIHKTDQWLHSGDEKYNDWLKNRIQGVESEKGRNRHRKGYSQGSLLNKYPQHRFLRDLFN